MAYRIHAAMHAMKVSPPHAPAHALHRQAAVAQLLEREHAPLAGCAARDEQVWAAPRRPVPERFLHVSMVAQGAKRQHARALQTCTKIAP